MTNWSRRDQFWSRRDQNGHESALFFLKKRKFQSRTEIEIEASNSFLLTQNILETLFSPKNRFILRPKRTLVTPAPADRVYHHENYSAHADAIEPGLIYPAYEFEYLISLIGFVFKLQNYRTVCPLRIFWFRGMFLKPKGMF